MAFPLVRLRPAQEQILQYQGGKMGISAVPGSGKTWTLSLLAANLVASGVLGEGQEVLVVTLVNSAVDNFNQRVGAFVRSFDIIPNLGYRVRTLHGLAHDIVRERPSLVGLADNFQIIDERAADAIRDEVARTWLLNHPGAFDEYLNLDLEEYYLNKAMREEIPVLVRAIALSFIRYAKDFQLTPEVLRQRLDRLPVPLPLAEMGWELFADYQKALNYRGAVDFDDLIRLALSTLEADHTYLERLQERWPYILEDEAQDSSRLQEQILSKLVGPGGNWVRVGDPNQAIYETFTTANPRYLRDFIKRDDVTPIGLPESGRSTLSIIKLANQLVRWTQNEHPLEAVRDALQSDPEIVPTALDDPQPNPADNPSAIHLVFRSFTPQEEVKAVADSLARYLPEHADATVAVLVPRNLRGFDLTNELSKREIPYEDGLLRSSTVTRFSASTLADLLHYLADPKSPRKLARVFEVWRGSDQRSNEERVVIHSIAEMIRKVTFAEDYLWPGPDRDWLEDLFQSGVNSDVLAALSDFRQVIRRWQSAALLPVDQVVLTLAQDILTEPVELAVTYKLALLLQAASRENPSWRLLELTRELDVIARNERRFLGFSQDETGFDPNQYRGKVVIGTIHKAKGLEWDRVYLMSVNNYDFPSGSIGDRYLPERWYLRDNLNLEAETLAQLKAVLNQNSYEWYEEGRPTQEARQDYIRERLRLLYVGITRAKKELVITWNTGRPNSGLTPALPFIALKNYWDSLA